MGNVVFGNHRFYWKKTKGRGGGSGDVFLKRKQEELEVFSDGPVVASRVFIFSVYNSHTVCQNWIK